MVDDGRNGTKRPLTIKFGPLDGVTGTRIVGESQTVGSEDPPGAKVGIITGYQTRYC
jgi:hypothetical protein